MGDTKGEIASQAVLVTGAAGFVGRAVMRVLAGEGWSVYPIVREPTGIPGEIVMDLSTLGMSRMLAELPIVDAVVHLAARVGWGGVPGPEMLSANVIATGMLAEWARRHQAYLVFASAAIVCGALRTRITPDTPPLPDTDYGRSKWLGEELIRYAGVPSAILRIAGIFGAGGPTHLGLNRAIASVLQGAPPTLYGDGRGRRNYIYVHDLAEIISRCLQERVTGIHLIAGRAVLSIAEMLQVLCDELLPGTVPRQVPGPEPRDHIVDPSPFLTARRSFREAIREIRREMPACA